MKTQTLAFVTVLGGAHQIKDGTKNVQVKIGEGVLEFSYPGKTETFPLQYVEASAKTETEISSRVTATRLLALGIFAFALKKKRTRFHSFLHLAISQPGLETELVADVQDNKVMQGFKAVNGLTAQQIVAEINAAKLAA